jgi:hypothetical protein
MKMEEYGEEVRTSGNFTSAITWSSGYSLESANFLYPLFHIVAAIFKEYA